MDELRRLIEQYDPYYEMSDDSTMWRRGAAIDRRIRALVNQLRVEGHGPAIDALMENHPCLISCPWRRSCPGLRHRREGWRGTVRCRDAVIP